MFSYDMMTRIESSAAPLQKHQNCHHSHIAPLKMELTLGSETSAFKTQTPGNNPEDCTLYSQHGESLKSTILFFKRAKTAMILF
jgi:hypothetical protein